MERNIIPILLAIVALACVLPFLPSAYSICFLVIAVSIFLAVKKIEVVIYFLIFYVPFEPLILKFLNDEAYFIFKYGAEVIIFILSAVAVGRRIIKAIKQESIKTKKQDDAVISDDSAKRWHIKTPIDIPLMIFILAGAVSAILNLTGIASYIFGLRQLFRFTLLYYAIIYAGIKKEAVKKMVIIFLAVLVLQALIGAGQAVIGKKADQFLLPDTVRKINNVVSPDYVEQSWASGQRVFAAMGRYDRLGTFMCFAMLLAIAFAVETESKALKKMAAAAFLISIPTFILTYSRMSWIGMILGIIFIGAFVKKNKKFILALAIFAGLTMSYLGLYMSSNGLRLYRLADKYEMAPAERILSLFSPVELKGSYNGYGRLYFIINTPVKVIKNYPFFGVGLGRYGSGVAYALRNKEVYDELRMPFGVQDKNGMIDNNWFSIWGETGTFGVLAFGAIISSLFLSAWNLYKKTTDDFLKGMALAFMSSGIAVCAQAFLGQYFEVRPLSFSFWVLAGAVGVLARNDKTAGRFLTR